MSPPEKNEKYAKGNKKKTTPNPGIHTKIHKKKFLNQQKEVQFSRNLLSKNEILNTESSGYLEPDEDESTLSMTQDEIVGMVDIASAAKHYQLHLDEFGPYRAKYTSNGRNLLLGGKMGHLAAFDCLTKKLHFEINAMETVHDISWLHNELMFAAAQKKWLYIYDKQGIELHCMKQFNKINCMEFLPHHFLLSTGSDEGFLSWLDVSTGDIVAQYNAKSGKINLMTQNPWNAVVCLGTTKGVVSMWAPKQRQCLYSMLCHKSVITGMHVDPSGTYMATSGADRQIKIWDVRKLKGAVQNYKVQFVPNCLRFSQKNVLGVILGNTIKLYKECCTTAAKDAYLQHTFVDKIASLDFCPFEDVLGVGTEKGFTSLLIPGSGEPNYDTFETNPFATTKQRQQSEVKSLLEKIQPEFICLNPNILQKIDVKSFKEQIEEKKKLLFVKPPKIRFEPRKKAKRRGGSVKAAKTKKILQEAAKMEFVKKTKENKLK